MGQSQAWRYSADYKEFMMVGRGTKQGQCARCS